MTEIVRMPGTEFDKLLELLDMPTSTTIIYLEHRKCIDYGPSLHVLDYGMANQHEVAAQFWKKLPMVEKVIVRQPVERWSAHD